MGSSFVEFQENGFWTRDAWLEVWLGCLVAEVDRQRDVPDWLREWQDHARLYASGEFTGCISAGLKDFVISEGQRQTMIVLCENTTRQMDEFGIIASDIKVGWVRSQSDIYPVVNEGVLSLRRAFMLLLQRQHDEYDKDKRRHWTYNQVAPLAWWSAQV